VIQWHTLDYGISTMKILLVSPEYYPFGIGGGSEVYKQLVHYYKKKKHSVTVVYGYYPTRSWNENLKKFKQNGVQFYQVPLIPTPNKVPLLKTRLPCNFQAYSRLSQIITDEKPDVAHLHGTGFPFIDSMAHKLRQQNIPYIITNHGNPGKIFRSNVVIQTAWKLYTALMLEPTLRGAKKITFVSNYTKNDSINKHRDKSITIYNGIDSSWHRVNKKTINIRKKHKISRNEKIILTVGRISEMKGLREMISVLPTLLRKGMKVRYLIMGHLGDMGYKKNLDLLISKLHLQNNVIFLGFLPEEEKKQYYKQADIIAIPSLWEGFGLVVLEAMSFNKVILSANKGSLPEVHNQYKKIVYLNDKSIVRSILEKMKLRSSFSFSKFDWDKISNEYLALLTAASRSVK